MKNEISFSAKKFLLGIDAYELNPVKDQHNLIKVYEYLISKKPKSKRTAAKVKKTLKAIETIWKWGEK